MTQFVEQFTLPAFVIDGDLSVKGMNNAAYRIVREADVVALRDGGLHCVDDMSTAKLRGLIAVVLDSRSREKKQSLVLRRSSTGNALHLWGMPLHEKSRTGQQLALLFLIDPDAAAAVPTPILQSVYGFTNAEGRLVEALLNGMTLEIFAARSHVSVNTARTHLKSIYRKTETNRQSDLIRLLAQFMCNINFIAHQLSSDLLPGAAAQH